MLSRKNQARGRDGKHPVTFQECMEIATKVLAANKVGMIRLILYINTNYCRKVSPYLPLFAGDPDAGLRKGEMKEKNDTIEKLEKENKALRNKIMVLEARYEFYSIIIEITICVATGLGRADPQLNFAQEWVRSERVVWQQGRIWGWRLWTEGGVLWSGFWTQSRVDDCH